IVLYKRHFNGIPVLPTTGPGEHIRLHIDNRGNLTAEQMNWRNAQLMTTFVPILSFEQVKADFERRLFAEMGNSVAEAQVTRIEFGYFGHGQGQPQGWFQPAYLFTVQFFYPDEQQATSARLVPVSAISPNDMKEPLEAPHPPSEQG